MLVETGTWYGAMALATLGRFERIYTIELDPRLHRRALRMFRNDPQVIPIGGDSAEQLGAVIGALEQPALFWLDAHYCGHGTARAATSTPLRAELEQILADPRPGHVILIDDAHDYGRLRDYPTIAEIEAIVTARRPHLELGVEGDIIRIHPPPGEPPPARDRAR